MPLGYLGDPDKTARTFPVVDGLRYAKRNRFLISLLVVDLSSMVFGMPRAVFTALGLHIYHGGHVELVTDTQQLAPLVTSFLTSDH